MKKTVIKIRHPLSKEDEEFMYFGDVTVIVGDSRINVIEHEKKHKTTEIKKNDGIVSVRNWG